MRFPVALARFLAVLAVFWLGPHAAFASVGFQRVEIVDLMAGPIEVGIWYPAAAPAAPSRLELFEQHVAPDATVLGDSLPLIVISHGHRGSFAGHHDTAIALAEAGFVAAALTHPRDNWRDASGATALWERPRQLKALTDYMLERWPDHARLDGRVGAFGFSAGGFTVLVTAGGIPDLRLIADHCRRHPQFEDCQIASGSLVAADDASITWVADHRIASVVAVAPALGYTFTPEGLESVQQPTQIWRAEYDRVLPHPYYAEPIRRALPRAPEMRVARNAGHYDFLSPCSASLAAEAPAICASGDNFDRARFHQGFNREVVEFFREALRPDGGGAMRNSHER